LFLSIKLIKALSLLYCCICHPQESSSHFCLELVILIVSIIVSFPSSLTLHFILTRAWTHVPCPYYGGSGLGRNDGRLLGSFQTCLAFNVRHQTTSRHVWPSLSGIKLLPFLKTPSSRKADVIDFSPIGVFVASCFFPEMGS
jgi:hypothetical protein